MTCPAFIGAKSAFKGLFVQFVGRPAPGCSDIDQAMPRENLRVVPTE
ncbi:MAG: lytic transglycosylase domain-containing protein, partial [Mesorhizobium sp.]